MATSNNCSTVSTVFTFTSFNTMNVTISAVISTLSTALALRPSNVTRAALKARARKALSAVSRKVNRPSKRTSRAAVRTSSAVARKAHRALVAVKAARRAVTAAALLADSAANKTVVFTTVHTCALPAPILKDAVAMHTCALPSPVLKDAAVVAAVSPVKKGKRWVAPESNVRAFTRAARAAKPVHKVHGLDEVVEAPELDVFLTAFSRADKIEADKVKASLKESRTEAQKAAIADKADAKTEAKAKKDAKKVGNTATKKVSKKAKADAKANKGGGNITSERKGAHNLVNAGPTANNNYGWVEISNEELFLSLELPSSHTAVGQAADIIHMDNNMTNFSPEVITENLMTLLTGVITPAEASLLAQHQHMTAATTVVEGSVVCEFKKATASINVDAAIAKAAAAGNTNATAVPAMTVAVQPPEAAVTVVDTTTTAAAIEFNVCAKPLYNTAICRLNKVSYYPSKEFTALNGSIPEGWFLHSTPRIKKGALTAAGNLFFSSPAGVFFLIMGKDGVFVNNSHIREFFYSLVGGKFNFLEYLEQSLNKTVAEVVQQHEDYLELNQYLSESDLSVDDALGCLAQDAEGDTTRVYPVDVAALKAAYTYYTTVMGYIEGGMSEDAAVAQAAANGLVAPEQPTRYVVREAVKTAKKTDSGKAVYAYDEIAYAKEAAVWVEKGYKVVGIDECLHIGNLSASHFRLDGIMPHTVITQPQVNMKHIKEWTADNVHEACMPVTTQAGLIEWIKSIQSKINSISIEFVAVSQLTEKESKKPNEAASLVHQYTFTAGAERYAAHGVELGSIPSFIIHFHSQEVLADTMVSVDVAKKIVERLTPISEVNKGAAITGNNVVGAGMKSILELTAKKSKSRPNLEEMNLVTTSSTVTEPTTTTEVAPALNTVEVVSTPVVEAIAIPTTSSAVTEPTTTTEVAPTPNTVEVVSTPVVEVIATPTIEDEMTDEELEIAIELATLRAALARKKAKAQAQAAAPVVAVTKVEAVAPVVALAAADTENSVTNNVVPDVVKKVQPEEESDNSAFCKAVQLKDLKSECFVSMMATANAFSIEVVQSPATSADLGEYSKVDGKRTITYREDLSRVHASQVLIHELVHAVVPTMNEVITQEMQDTFIVTPNELYQNWLNSVGQSALTPAGSSLEEQFAYSFMEYEHDVDSLMGFFYGLDYPGNDWVEHYNNLEAAAKATSQTGVAVTLQQGQSVVKATAPTAKVLTINGPIVKGPMTVVIESSQPLPVEAMGASTNPLDSLSDDAIIAMDVNYKASAAMMEAYPELGYEGTTPDGLSVQTALGSVNTIPTKGGLVIHAICCVNDNGGFEVGALEQGLRTLKAQDVARRYSCESSLGYGDHTGNTATMILGKVRGIIGGDYVTTLTLPSMKTFVAKASGNVPLVSYNSVDFLLWKTELMLGTCIELILCKPNAQHDIFDGTFNDRGDTAQGTLAVLNADGTVDEGRLTRGIAALNGYISDKFVPLPIYCYSNQAVAFKGLTIPVKVVSYKEGTLLPGVAVRILKKSPMPSLTVAQYYEQLLMALSDGDESADDAGSVVNCMVHKVTALSEHLYKKAFSMLGIDVNLAQYALFPIPVSWVESGLILVIPGEDANGLIKTKVEFEQLIDSALLKVLTDNGVRVYTAVQSYDPATKKMVIAGVRTPVHGIDNLNASIDAGYDVTTNYCGGVLALPAGNDGAKMLEAHPVLMERYLNDNVIGRNLFEPKDTAKPKLIEQLMQKHLYDTVQYLVDTQGVSMAIEYMKATLPDGFIKKEALSGNKEVYSIAVYNKMVNNTAEYALEFTPVEGKIRSDRHYLNAKHCSITSGSKENHFNCLANLAGFTDTIYTGATTAIALAITAAAGRQLTQSVFEGYMAGVTNLMRPNSSYGMGPQHAVIEQGALQDPRSVIEENKCKTVSAVYNRNIIIGSGEVDGENASKARWPYFMASNASLDLSMMKYLIVNGMGPVIAHKYGTEHLVIGEGARAMCVFNMTDEEATTGIKGYDEGNFGIELLMNKDNGGVVATLWSPTDKAGKTCSRPSQFHGASQADGWHHPLQWSSMLTKVNAPGTPDKYTAFKGTMARFIIAATDYLSEGSGVATQQNAACSLWEYAVPGSKNVVYEASQVPTVQNNMKDGRFLLGLTSTLNGPAPNSDTLTGKDSSGKDVNVSTWFAQTFANEYIIKAIERAMVNADGTQRIYGPGEEMVVLFDKLYDANGNEVVGYYPDGTVAGLPSARVALFTNETKTENYIITGYSIVPSMRGERLSIKLNYSTVMDTGVLDTSKYSGIKLRVEGVKAIIAHQEINYLGNTIMFQGNEVSLDAIRAQGGIHITSEGLKGNNLFIQAFGPAHGCAWRQGAKLYIHEYLLNGEVNPHYDATRPEDMVSDMTDTSSYFYRWMKSLTKVVRIQKTFNKNVWDIIVAANADSMIDGKLPGVEIVKTEVHSLVWDAEDANGGAVTTDSHTVTVEYDVEIAVIDAIVQIEVAPPGSCIGNQGMTGDQAATIEVMSKDTAKRILDDSAAAADGVEKAITSAKVHKMLETNQHVPGVFWFNPLDVTHQAMVDHLMYQVSDAGANGVGIRTLRPAKELYMLMAAMFGGAGADTTKLWAGLIDGTVTSIDCVDKVVKGEVKGKHIVTVCDAGFNFMSVPTFAKHVHESVGVEVFYDTNGNEVVEPTPLHLGEYVTEDAYQGQGLAIYTTPENGNSTAVTYVDPTVFILLGAFESYQQAANPATNAPSRRVTGAATGVVNDIHRALLNWTTKEFWLRKGATGLVHGKNCLLRKSMMGWIGVNSARSTMMNAKGVLSRLAKIDRSASVAGKICTGTGKQFAPQDVIGTIIDEDGNEVRVVIGQVPVAIIHPDCMLAQGLKHGDIIALGRTPTVSLVFCMVMFSRTYGRIGYVHTCFVEWAKGNNGDSDGDQCSRAFLGGTNKDGTWFGVTPKDAVEMNKHPLSTAGYDVVCGTDVKGHDYAEFVSFKDVWCKKTIDIDKVPQHIKDWAVIKKYTIKQLEPLVNLILPSELFSFTEKVGAHYRANVGVAYGWCSAYTAHMKEKHSFLEALLTHFLSTPAVLAAGIELPTVKEMLDVLCSGEIYEAMYGEKGAGNAIHFDSTIRFDYAELDTAKPSWLSLDYNEPITHNGVTYPTLGEAYSAIKCKLFNIKYRGLSVAEVEAMLYADTALAAEWSEALNRQLASLLNNRYSTVEFQALLEGTGNAHLEHGTYIDGIWTVTEDNKLGQMIMAIRSTTPTGLMYAGLAQGAEEAIYKKYPSIMYLVGLKLGAAQNPMNLALMGQHIKVMFNTTAWLWRGAYEGLGLSGYSANAATFFEAFTYGLRHKGMVLDTSTVDDKGNVRIGVDKPNSIDGIDGVFTNMTLGAFLSKHYNVSLDIANEMFAACLLYNGYRSIERGEHIQGKDENVPTKLANLGTMYLEVMSDWPDTVRVNAPDYSEFMAHTLLAGVFRRAGQGTTGVDINDELHEGAAAQMIYTKAAQEYGTQITGNVKIFQNGMLNTIFKKSVYLYCQLVEISAMTSPEIIG